jgi:hypothetical protein
VGVVSFIVVGGDAGREEDEGDKTVGWDGKGGDKCKGGALQMDCKIQFTPPCCNRSNIGKGTSVAIGSYP